MTYCVGWKYKNSVYLIADTAVTKSSEVHHNSSSFGEFHRYVRDGYVEESLLKIVPISENIVVGFAGNVQLATSVIDYIKENLMPDITNQNLRYLVSNIEKSLGPFHVDRAVQLVIAKTSVIEESDLIFWDTINGICRNNKNIYHLGSMESYHSSLTDYILFIMSKGNIDEDRLLAIVLAMVQSYGVNDDMLEQNIGGIIWGIRNTNGQLYWQEDTNYVIYDNEASLIWVTAFELENVLIVSSTKRDGVVCFAHSSSLDTEEPFLEKWGEYIRNYFTENKTRYWIHIRKKDKLLTIIRREDLEKPSKYISVSKGEDEDFTLSMSPELMNLLNEPLKDLGSDSIPVKINFLND